MPIVHEKLKRVFCFFFAKKKTYFLPFFLTSCEPGVLNPAGTIGQAETQILLDSLAIMLAIVVPTLVTMLAFMWWFRASNSRASSLPNWNHSGQLELLVWAIPLLTIMLLGGVTWLGSHALDPAKPLEQAQPPLEVQVVSLDWKFLFIYPEQGIASVNRLVIPAGDAVHFSLTSASVMNAFFIPRLGSMIYMMNGMRTQLNLRADGIGTYRGLSSHFSGDGFSGMHFDVQSVSGGDFAKWVATARAGGPVLTAASYTQLARQSMDVSPFTYSAAEPGLFDKIVTQALPPGAGPATLSKPICTAQALHAR